jgi:hypothetical protein
VQKKEFDCREFVTNSLQSKLFKTVELQKNQVVSFVDDETNREVRGSNPQVV